MSAKLRNNRKPMSEEQRAARQARMAGLEHWARCRRCGFTLKGTLAELREHNCGQSTEPTGDSETAI